MPLIKSAKKRARQALVRRDRNYNVRTAVRKAIRAFKDAVKANDASSASTLLSAAYKIIDTASKKNIIKQNTASRRKSSLAKIIAEIGSVKAEPVAKKTTPKKTDKPATKTSGAKKTAAKKTTAKKSSK